MEINKKEFKYNGKDFIFVREYEDEKYGKITKAISKKLEDFEILYFKNENNNLSLITDEETIQYIYEKYDEIIDDIEASKHEFER